MKKLLVILGAGASIEFGMPSVNDVDKLFDEWANTAFPLINKSGNRNNSLYGWVKENAINSSTGNINFENILHTIHILSSLDNEELNPNNIGSFVESKVFPEVRIVERSGGKMIANGGVFNFLNSYLTNQLLSYLRNKGRELTLKKTNELRIARDFFKFLENDYDIGFVNLNYDNVLLSVLPELFTGFDSSTGKFNMDKLYYEDTNFCYHLHGSVHLDLNNSGDEITWKNNLDEKFGWGADYRRGYTTQEGKIFPMSSIVTGLDKVQQIQREPFRQYFMRLDHRIYESDNILFIGYGFNDSYLNNLISSHCKIKRRNIVVIDYQHKETRSLFNHGNEWGNNLLSTLKIPYYEMSNGQSNLINTPKSVEYFLKNKSFEYSTSKAQPLYVWYSGFLDACKNMTKIKGALNERIV